MDDGESSPSSIPWFACSPVEQKFPDEEDNQEAVIPRRDLDARVKAFCAALAEAERGGHAFIAPKRFR